jgi:hypothetical protein
MIILGNSETKKLKQIIDQFFWTCHKSKIDSFLTSGLNKLIEKNYEFPTHVIN